MATIVQARTFLTKMQWNSSAVQKLDTAQKLQTAINEIHPGNWKIYCKKVGISELIG